MKSALIIGADGQDGKLLYEHLQRQGYSIYRIDQKNALYNAETISPIDITSTQAVFDFIKDKQPDEIYYLAAYHISSEGKPEENVIYFENCYKINELGYINVLEAVRLYCSSSRIFYACSSHIFAGSSKAQDEQTPVNPDSFYGISKANGLFLGRMYRKHYGLFVSSGILYNHESVYRSEAFITKKIIMSAARIKAGQQDKLTLGNPEAEVDWGYAPDYVAAMQLVLNLKEADDFIIASGEKHKVKEFAKLAFEQYGLNWQQYIEEDKSVMNKETVLRIGNPAKLKKAGWQLTVSFKEMISLLAKGQK